MNKIRLLIFIFLAALVVSFANVSPAGAATVTVVTLQEGTATFSQGDLCCNLNVDEAVDGQLYDYGASGTYNGWATYDGISAGDHTAVWETASDVNASRLDFALYHTWCCSHSLGRFRLSYTTDDRSTFADDLNSGGDVTANWTVLTGATISGTGGETFTVLGDNSILVGGNNPDTTVYSVSFEGNFNSITGIRLESLTDPSLPTGGAGRGGNGNWHLVEITLDATFANPLDDGGWELVAHMSNSGGMFDGNGELLSTYSYGTFVANPVASTPDFQRAFPVIADKILFITGDLTIWAIADYGDLRALIDAPAPGSVSLTALNLAFEIGVNGIVSNSTGNVLSRTGVNEDPWISMDGDHNYGRDNERIVWGENNYSAGIHQALKNSHGGINVYVMAADNEPPTANAGGPYNGNEGSAIALSDATASDPDLDTLTYAWTVDSASCSFNDANGLNPNLTCSDDGNYTATLSVDDGVNPAVSSDASVTVGNVAPTVGLVSMPTAPIDINNQPVNGVSAPFTDPGTDTHTCTVDYDDGSGPQVGTVAAGVCTGLGNTYTESGVYVVTIEVTDDELGVGSAIATGFIVIYDPSGGFVTGGGWFDSPINSEYQYMQVGGKANFGFVAKYKKGANVPDGNTQFQFKAGDLNFHSTSYEWLVVAGNKAQFRGEGTINGEGSYTFMIWADDDSPDTFQIKIWGANGIVYDNGPHQPLGGGSIKVHN